MTVGRLLLLFGSACVIVVVLTHVAEAFHVLPATGWGLPNSAGHYLARFLRATWCRWASSRLSARGAKIQTERRHP
jgi:hypothetical protein